MVTKNILEQYTDLQKELNEIKESIKKTEREIKRIEEEGTVQDTVTGGIGGNQHYIIEGIPTPLYHRKKSLLYNRKAIQESLELEVLETLNKIEEFIKTVDDSQVRRIIKFRFIDRLSWREVAQRIGGGNTEGSVKMAFQRFMEKK